MEDRSLAEILEDHGIPAEILADPIVNRRAFLAALGGGVAILMMMDSAASAEQAEDRTELTGGRGGPERIAGWLHIGEDGAITGYVGKVEMGQNARTSLTQVIAEELHVQPGAVRLVMGDTALTPFDIGTFGSLTTPRTVPPLRKAAAAARELLLDLASDQLLVGKSTLTIGNGKVTHGNSGRSLSFGELTKGQELVQPIPEDTPTVSPERWRVVGTSVPKVDVESIVTGLIRYASDVHRPGMWHVKILRPPGHGARLSNVDTSALEARSGFVVARDGEFVGVAAAREADARAATDSLEPEWDLPTLPSQADLFEHLTETAGDGGGRGSHSAGSIEAGLAEAEVKIEATYTVDYIAHAAIEPRSAIAEWEGDSVTIWTATQAPFRVRSGVAQALGIPEANVRAIAVDTGNGFGGKTWSQPALEAARLAKVAGRPVRVAWTREEELTWNHFRPAGVITAKSGARRDGKLTAWEYHNLNSGSPGMGTPYDVANQLIEHHPCDSPLPQGAYRGLASPVNIWARETHMDEMADALDMDPLVFRLANLSDDRLRTVLEAAAERFGWEEATAQGGRGFGIACGYDKGGYTATCAEVTVGEGGKVQVNRIVTAFECGAVINPTHLRNQLEGAAVMALGPALFESIKHDNGTITNADFSGYRLPRFSDTPKIDTVLVDRRDLPSAGAGETPFAGIAPAIGNAIFRATGTRLRSLPMAPNGVLT